MYTHAEYVSRCVIHIINPFIILFVHPFYLYMYRESMNLIYLQVMFTSLDLPFLNCLTACHRVFPFGMPCYRSPFFPDGRVRPRRAVSERDRSKSAISLHVSEPVDRDDWKGRGYRNGPHPLIFSGGFCMFLIDSMEHIIGYKWI